MDLRAVKRAIPTDFIGWFALTLLVLVLALGIILPVAHVLGWLSLPACEEQSDHYLGCKRFR